MPDEELKSLFVEVINDLKWINKPVTDIGKSIQGLEKKANMVDEEVSGGWETVMWMRNPARKLIIKKKSWNTENKKYTRK